MTENIIEVNKENFNSEIIDNILPVLVDFWAPWCGPCRAIAPHLEKIRKNFLEKIKIVKINIDENPKIAKDFNVKSIPTLLFFKNGKYIDRIVGGLSELNLENFIKNNI